MEEEIKGNQYLVLVFSPNYHYSMKYAINSTRFPYCVFNHKIFFFQTAVPISKNYL